jgi:hypothetical protein
MHSPPKLLSSLRAQAVIAGLAAAALAIGGFQMGRYTADAAAFVNKTAAIPNEPPSNAGSHKDALAERQQDRIIIRDIATVPFSELYDVLKAAPREQLLAWARDLERMPRGPRQRAAVTAYYKSLIQVDHRAAIEAVLHSENLNMRDIAIAALMKAAPESIWGELTEMTNHLPHPWRGFYEQDPIWNWSRVDPVAVAKYIDKFPSDGKDEGSYALLYNWGKISPEEAKDWLEADPTHQKKESFRGFVLAWAEVDRGAAINYAVANANKPDFQPALKDLSYYLFRLFPDDARTFVLLLPPQQANAAMQKIADTSTGVILHAPEDYQRPPDVVTRWMVSLPIDLWRGKIGDVFGNWIGADSAAATTWLNQLAPEIQDVAVADYCHSASTETAEQTILLGLTIHDQKLRDAVLGEFARRLGETRESAIAAVDQVPISREQKAYLHRVMPEASSAK